MKKFMCLILCVVMVFSSLSVFAFSDNDNEELKNVLLIVKSKVHIPSEFTEFNMSIRGSNSSVNNMRYEYFWETKDRTKSLSVSSDKSGNIVSYSFYDAQNEKTKSDISVKYDTAFEVADAFIKRALPLCFENKNDSFVIKDDISKTGSLSGNTVYFNFVYQRTKDGYPVSGNTADINVILSGDRVVVSNMNSSWDYEGAFHNAEKIIDNPVDAYLREFPLEMVYKNKYSVYKLSEDDDINTPALVYRFRDNQSGYILADKGEKFNPQRNVYIFNSAMKEEMSADSVTGGGLRAELTPEEIDRIDKISSLLSVDDAQKILRENKHLSIDDEYIFKNSSLTRQYMSEDDYIRSISFSFSTDKKSGDIYAGLDAKSGEILSYSRSVYGVDVYDKEYEATEEDKKSAFDKIEAFVNDTASSKINEYKLKADNEYNYRAEKVYERYIDGVRYIDNTINASYDMRENFISGYNISYTKEFKNLPLVKDAIDTESAQSIIFELYPLSLSYMRGEDGYYLCFGNDNNRNAEIYAINGKKVSDNVRNINLKPYTDISDHWVRDAAEKLLNIGIGFEDGALKPDEICLEKDFLRIMMCAVNKSAYYLTYTDDNLYSRLESRKYISNDEKNPEGSVKREDAFVYTVRMMNYEEIARLKDIFKTDFLDHSDISEDKTGYAAILKGFGLISGDGTHLRPKSDITRAEVISMAYNCIVNR